MHILDARLTGFRNLDDASLSFSPGVNVIMGANGQGKTNLLEALDYFALGRSHRGARNEELVRLDGDHLHVAFTLARDDGASVRCEYGLDRGRRPSLQGRRPGHRPPRDLLGILSTVFFWPESVDLVRGGPELRRRFADQGLSGLDPAYLAALTQYNRGLRQKSRILKDLRRGLRDGARAREELAAWNRDLASHAVVLTRGRHRWVRELAPHAAAAHHLVSNRDEPLDIAYRPRFECLSAVDAGTENLQLAEEILAEFDYIGPEEIRRGRPLTGPHLDDFNVRLADLDVRVYGSQGETRSAAIAMILAQSDVVHQRRRVRPVLFLDDIFSELDRDRARRVQERCARDHQVFIATARSDDVAGWQPTRIRSWRVDNGSLAALA